jgi:hypothetical protein
VGGEIGGGTTAGVHRSGDDPWADCRFQTVESTSSILRLPPEYLAQSPEGWWLVMCGTSAGFAGGFALWPRSEGLPPQVRDVLVASAVSALEVPYLTPQTSPAGTPSQPLITGLETWLWVDPASWSPVQASAAIPIATVTATATPTTLTWQAGDGSPPRGCDGPGQPWDAGSDASPAGCRHRYDRSSRDAPNGTWPLAVTVEWAVTWTCTPGCGGGDAAPFVLNVTRPVTVHQVQSRISR